MEVPCGEGQTSPQEDTDNGPCRPTPQYPVQHASIPLQPSPNAGPYFAQQYAFANMVGPQFGQPFQGFVSADSPFQQQPQYHTIPLDDRTNFQHGPYPAFNPLGMHQSSSFRTPPRYAAGNEAVKKTGRSSDPAAKLPQEDDDKSSDEDEDLTEVLCGQPAARGGGAKGSNALNTAKTGPGSLTAKKLEVAARVRAEKAAAKEAKRTAAAAKKAEEGPKQKGRGKKKGGDGEGDAGGDGAAGGGGSSHWSRTELGQCISLRCELHPKFTQMGSQQEHWNKIALKMASLGYSRTPGAIKTKWEEQYKLYREMYDKRQKSGGGDNNEGAGEDNLHIEFEDPLMQMIHTVMKHRANAQPQVRVQANGGGGNVYTQVPSETDGEKGGLGALRRGRGESIVHAINQKLAKSSEDHRQSLLEAVTESDTKLLSGLKDIMTACFQPLTDKRPREVPEKSDAPVDPSLLQWLKKHSLEAHAPKFAAEEITLASLKYLEKENLVEMGMAIGPRNLVWGLIQDGKASGGFV